MNSIQINEKSLLAAEIEATAGGAPVVLLNPEKTHAAASKALNVVSMVFQRAFEKTFKLLADAFIGHVCLFSMRRGVVA